MRKLIILCLSVGMVGLTVLVVDAVVVDTVRAENTQQVITKTAVDRLVNDEVPMVGICQEELRETTSAIRSPVEDVVVASSESRCIALNEVTSVTKAVTQSHLSGTFAA